ncbi:MAG: hypothetical protein H0W84_01015 [Bacteroidetes bacterium]|nr:hypothetical protein [Bacteroidota bacterium]
MKKLTSEEFENLSLRGRGRSSEVFNSIVNLKAGEAVLIEHKDWKRKAGPSTLVRYIEKKHQMKFSCSALSEGNGWAIRRIDEIRKSNHKEESSVKIPDNQRLQLKSDILVFYLGRMAFQKIERIEDSIKTCIEHFWKNERELVKELFFEITKGLEEQGHIVIENGKTYIPLRRN